MNLNNINPKYSETTLDFNSRIGRQLLQWESLDSSFVEQLDDSVVIETKIGSSMHEDTILIQDIEEYCLEWLSLPNYATKSDDAFLEWLDLMPSKELANTAKMAKWYKVYKKQYYENLAFIQANNRELNHIPHQAPQWLMCVGDPRE